VHRHSKDDTPGEKKLVAYLVADGQPVPSTTELRDFLHEKLPEHMIPAAFIELDALPLTLSAKIDRRSLPVPDQARPHLEKGFIAPRTPVEKEHIASRKNPLQMTFVASRKNPLQMLMGNLR
jgi:hypothetical protein